MSQTSQPDGIEPWADWPSQAAPGYGQPAPGYGQATPGQTTSGYGQATRDYGQATYRQPRAYQPPIPPGHRATTRIAGGPSPILVEFAVPARQRRADGAAARHPRHPASRPAVCAVFRPRGRGLDRLVLGAVHRQIASVGAHVQHRRTAVADACVRLLADGHGRLPAVLARRRRLSGAPGGPASEAQQGCGAVPDPPGGPRRDHCRGQPAPGSPSCRCLPGSSHS